MVKDVRKEIERMREENRKMTDEEKDHTPLTFGKYAGQTPDSVSNTKAGCHWLVWAFETVKDKTVCSSLLYRECQEEIRTNKFEDPDVPTF